MDEKNGFAQIYKWVKQCSKYNSKSGANVVKIRSSPCSLTSKYHICYIFASLQRWANPHLKRSKTDENPSTPSHFLVSTRARQSGNWAWLVIWYRVFLYKYFAMKHYCFLKWDKVPQLSLGTSSTYQYLLHRHSPKILITGGGVVRPTVECFPSRENNGWLGWRFIYSNHTHFNLTVLEHLGALWIMGEMANISDKTFKKRSLNGETRHVQINDTKWHENSNFHDIYFLSWERLL